MHLGSCTTNAETESRKIPALILQKIQLRIYVMPAKLLVAKIRIVSG